MRQSFANARRAGFDIGLSTNKLTRAMVEILLQLPPETNPSKQVVVAYLGLLGQMSKTRDINSAWNSAKGKVVREHPERFCLIGKALRHVTPEQKNQRREQLSAAGQRKLTSLAAKEGLTPDELLGQLMAVWRKAKRAKKT